MTGAGLVESLTRASEPREYPDGSPYKSLPIKEVSRLSQAHKMPGRDVEIAALRAGLLPERYARNRKSFSLEEQATLLGSRVSVVGLGGLGGIVTEILSRIGVGTLDLVDGDAFEESNLNRQLLSTEARLHIPKAVQAAQRVEEINSSVVVSCHQAYLNDDNARRLLDQTNVIVDCIGGVKDRYVVERAARALVCPMVSAAVGGDLGHVITVFPGEEGFERIYGEEESVSSMGVEATLGCLPHVTTLLATLECSEVVKILLKKENLLRNQMLAVDLSDYTFEVLKLRPEVRQGA